MAAEQTTGLKASLRVLQARFGDKEGALALLESPPQMREFFRQLADKADLPDSAPPGATWEPFVRGWRHENWYVVTLTQPDDTAVRPGMIATRMLAFSLADFEQWDDMNAVLECLHRVPASFVPEFTISANPLNVRQTVAPGLLACVASNLIHENKSVAIVGQKEFEAVIAELWRRLPADLRRTFSFGFSFTPADLTVTRANIVAVPASCEVRWNSYKYRCDANWNHALSDPVAAFLGNPEARGFCQFLTEVKLVIQAFEDYARYARLWSYWQKRSENNPELLLALLRSLGTLIPDPGQALTQKKEALRCAATLVSDGTCEAILSLRSVKASSFPNKAKVLGDAVCAWVKSRFYSSTADTGADLCKVIQAVPSSQSAEWQDWVRSALQQVFASLTDRVSQAIWSVWKQDDGTHDEIATHLSTNEITEMSLVRTCPTSISAKLFTSVTVMCERRAWICLSAKAAFVHLGFLKAIALVLQNNAGESRTAAIDLLCKAAKPAEVWQSAFAYADTELVSRAVTAASTEPSLWLNSENDVRHWMVILEAASETKPDFLRNVDAPAIKPRIFEAWEAGSPITEPMCEAMEKAGQLEFAQYPGRSRLWSKLPRRYRGNALTNTVRAWLNDYYSRPPTKPTLEDDLVEIVFAATNTEFAFPRDSQYLGIGGLTLVEAWGTERDCESWLLAVFRASSKLSLNAAQRAGDLVVDRHWSHVAKTAKDLDERRGRSDFRPIWAPYYDSLSRLEKFAFNLFAAPARYASIAPPVLYSKTMIDAVFVTALPEEFSAVRAHLSERREHTEKGTVYEIGSFVVDQTTCNVAIVQTGMGNALSAAATERVLNLFKPTFAFFVGIAGGLRDDLKIGDVVAANKVYGYEGGKSGITFQPRPDAPPVSHEAEQRANAVVRDKVWYKRIEPYPRNLPDAIVRPIAAGEKVLVSETSEDLKRVRATYTDAYAVAMEDHGFATAIRAHPNVCFAVVRGISDLIENKAAADRSGSHEIAAKNAAAFAFEMLAGFVRARNSVQHDEPPLLD